MEQGHRPRPEPPSESTDGRVAAVGDQARVLADARRDGVTDVIDLTGAFVTPGLINSHTHLSLGLPGALGAALDRMSAHELVLYMADGARRTLEAGVTTVRCVAERDGADFALRGAIDSGRATGPRIFTAGRALVCTGGHGHGHGDTLECDGPAEFRKGARRQISLGADLIKVMISGGIAGEHEAMDTPQLQPDEMEAVISTAHDWGRKVTAHAGPAGIIEKAVRLGLDGVEHGYHLTGDVARLMAQRNVTLVPTLVVTRCGEFFDQLDVPCWMQQRSLSAGGRHLESYQYALEAGVEVMLGSDMPPFWEFEGTTATVRELEWMIDGGLSPAAALQAATIVPARWLGADADIGTLEPGKRADLIALGADPLAEAEGVAHHRLGDEGRGHRAQRRVAAMNVGGATAGTAVTALIDDLYAAVLAGDRPRFDRHLAPGVTIWESHVPDDDARRRGAHGVPRRPRRRPGRIAAGVVGRPRTSWWTCSTAPPWSGTTSSPAPTTGPTPSSVSPTCCARTVPPAGGSCTTTPNETVAG